MFDLLQAISSADFERARELFTEYGEGLPIEDRTFQDFDGEVAGLETMYTPPCGVLVLAQADGALGGCVALRHLEPGICEMKRLYVRPGVRKSGLGRILAVRIVEEARRLGYQRMRLDTLRTMTAAQALYETMGFRRIEPYNDTPVVGMVFMELNLIDNGERQK